MFSIPFLHITLVLINLIYSTLLNACKQYCELHSKCVSFLGDTMSITYVNAFDKIDRSCGKLWKSCEEQYLHK